MISKYLHAENHMVQPFAYFQIWKLKMFVCGNGRAIALSIAAGYAQKEQSVKISDDGEYLFGAYGEGLREETSGAFLQPGNRTDSTTYVRLLQTCVNTRALGEGKSVHAHIIRFQPQPEIFVRNNLVNMYAKCGSLEHARKVFDKMPERNTISWNAVIAGYAQQGRGEESFNLFSQMCREGLKPTNFTFASVVNACGSMESLDQGIQILAHTIKTGFNSDVYVGSSLVDMYARCGSVGDARQVFDKMYERNEVTWNAMVAGYARHRHIEDAFDLFGKMQCTGIKATQFTYASVLNACSSTSPEYGKQVHSLVIKSKIESNIFVGNALINMYAKCASIEDACKIFGKMAERDVISWNAMIAGYAQNDHEEEALKLFFQMSLVGIRHNRMTFSSILKACASMATLKQGQQLHAQAINEGFGSSVFVGSALVDMYAKCGDIDDARQVFDEMYERNVVSWNALIAGYSECEENLKYCKEALTLFRQMKIIDMKTNEFTFASVLRVCASLVAVENGKQVHAQIIKTRFDSDVFVGSALVGMYAKCSTIEDACKIFNRMPKRNIVSWNTMIAAYVQHGQAEEAFRVFSQMQQRDMVSWNSVIAMYSHNGHSEDALRLFCQMQQAGMKADQFTFVSAFSACASLVALEQGREVHPHVIKRGFQSDCFVANVLIDMYAKCGSIEDAHSVFDKMPNRNLISWTAMISGYAQHGHGKEALSIFEQMQQEGVKPDHVTFVSVLSACSHAGLVDEGWHYFNSMSQDYGITPRGDHCACMVDILGRAGCLDEAENFIHEMTFKPDALVWRTLLGACRIYGNIQLGKHAADRVFDLDPEDSAAYVVLANIHAKAGEWEEVAKVRKMMKDRGVKKGPGCSWIEVRNKVHAFVMGDRLHPQTEEIYAKLERLAFQMQVAGYKLNTSSALHNVEKKQKEHCLSHHSEKLAIAFGLISTPPGAPIRVIKNLRVCEDCHTASKFISKIVGREIVVRDATRFHHFKDGLCSCGEYW